MLAGCADSCQSQHAPPSLSFSFTFFIGYSLVHFFLLFIYDDPRPASNFKVSLFRPLDQFAGRPINSRINNSLRLNISNYRKRRIHSIYYKFSEDAFNCSLFSRAMKILRRIFLHLFSTEMNE